jgi:hypothetical protein
MSSKHQGRMIFPLGRANRRIRNILVGSVVLMGHVAGFHGCSPNTEPSEYWIEVDPPEVVIYKGQTVTVGASTNMPYDRWYHIRWGLGSGRVFRIIPQGRGRWQTASVYGVGSGSETIAVSVDYSDVSTELSVTVLP